ncbi:hypothetical protein H310_14539 [Aphanomyces invadans]|uniref:Uncharacterized protein n=1 Tax=Aphanomyces invadans TaxID=157072 RepID=A0A024TAW0_9STRA|nr:hypothetical protein H310_14539 [Aphanomyces invadans]ETV90751.1 hypothetical protein H310_14539 [Aphanomyces invadans]|eukprot:XP_008880641.1 hypothetical protein H310_14539 [Aphanomyces invadans]
MSELESFLTTYRDVRQDDKKVARSLESHKKKAKIGLTSDRIQAVTGALAVQFSYMPTNGPSLHMQLAPT